MAFQPRNFRVLGKTCKQSNWVGNPPPPNLSPEEGCRSGSGVLGWLEQVMFKMGGGPPL